VLRTAAALADGEPIARAHLPSFAAAAIPSALPVPVPDPERDTGAELEVASTAALPVKLNPIQANERKVLLQLLEQHRWNVSNVAKALDVSRNTLYRKLHKLHIEVSHPE
jgi:transcriptional regulator of acetoin/glycerol metabolism